MVIPAMVRSLGIRRFPNVVRATPRRDPFFYVSTHPPSAQPHVDRCSPDHAENDGPCVALPTYREEYGKSFPFGMFCEPDRPMAAVALLV